MQRLAFEKLTVSQKIHKLASVARESIHSPHKRALFWECVAWIVQSPHPRLKRAWASISRVQAMLHHDPTTWYHLYHNLLALNTTTLDEEDFCPSGFDREEPLARWQACVLLCDVRSPFNAGSIIRTAEAFGWKEVALSGITPRSDHPRVAKTSMNTHEWLPVRDFSSHLEAITHYRRQDYRICALETSPGAQSIWDTPWPEKILVIVGNEEFGITQEVLQHTDGVLKIPLYGRKLSLNVANSFAIVAAAASRQWALSHTQATEKN